MILSEQFVGNFIFTRVLLLFLHSYMVSSIAILH